MRPPFQTRTEEAEALANDDDEAGARQIYQSVWSSAECEGTSAWPLEAAWVGLSLADSHLRAREYDAAYGVLVAVHERFAAKYQVVGNPFFHFCLGASKFHRAPPEERARSGPGTAMDDLARALSGAGIELFDGEDPAYLAAVVKEVSPPHPFASWEASRGHFKGANREALEDAPASLFDRFVERGLIPRRNLFDFFRPETKSR